MSRGMDTLPVDLLERIKDCLCTIQTHDLVNEGTRLMLEGLRGSLALYLTCKTLYSHTGQVVDLHIGIHCNR